VIAKVWEIAGEEGKQESRGCAGIKVAVPNGIRISIFLWLVDVVF